MIERICQNCGTVFMGGSSQSKYCPACKPIMKKKNEELFRQNKRIHAAQRANERASAKQLEKFNDILRRIDAYNAQNHTNLSYGKYLALNYAEQQRRK